MNEHDVARYRCARLRLYRKVIELGGVPRRTDIETSLCEDRLTVMLLVEVRPDEYAISEFKLADQIDDEEEFDRTWRSRELVHQ